MNEKIKWKVQLQRNIIDFPKQISIDKYICMVG